MNLLFSPHNDDETLWTAYTIQKEKPLVVIVFDSYVQAARGERSLMQQRRAETLSALDELESLPPLFLGYRDDQEPPLTISDSIRHLIERHKPAKVWAPAIEENGHKQHNIVGRVVHAVFPGAVHYLTYTRTNGKSRGIEVKPEPDMIRRKHRALACYGSQIEVENCRDHFVGDIREYIAA